MDKKQYNNYLAILREELMPAMGCTEPIAIALAAAKAREVLGHMPEQMKATCSGNIVKNVKGVVVPNSGGQRGIRAAAVLGAVAGDASKGLEVIADAKEDDIARVKELCSQGFCDQALQEDEENLFIRIDVSAGDDTAAVEIRQNHDNISYIEKNGTVLLKKKPAEVSRIGDKSRLNMDDIIDFADEVDIEPSDRVQYPYIGYWTSTSMGCRRRLHTDEGGLQKHQDAGTRGGCSRLRCTHERLLSARHHQLWKRQSGHNLHHAHHRLRKGAWHRL